MKVLHLIKTSKGAVWAFNFIKDLKELHPEIKFHVVLPSDGELYNQYKAICEEVYEFDFSLNLDIFKNGKALKKIATTVNPDIIHSWFTQTTLYSRIFLRSLKIPRIFQVVGPLHLESKLFKYADIWSSNKKDYWVATSKYIYDKYQKVGIPKERLFLTYAYIDIHKLEEKSKSPAIDYHKKFKLPENTKIIGTASYIYSPKFYQETGVKGHEYLINAFAELLKKRQDIFLVIAGESFTEDQQYYNKLKKLAEEKCDGRVAFTGGYKNIYTVIHNFNVFVYLSKSENLGGVYESLLFKVPTLSSNKGGLPELVIENQTGYTVDYDDYECISEKINLILNKDLASMKEKGRKKVLSIFRKETILQNGYAVYRKLSQ